MVMVAFLYKKTPYIIKNRKKNFMEQEVSMNKMGEEPVNKCTYLVFLIFGLFGSNSWCCN